MKPLKSDLEIGNSSDSTIYAQWWWHLSPKGCEINSDNLGYRNPESCVRAGHAMARRLGIEITGVTEYGACPENE